MIKVFKNILMLLFLFIFIVFAMIASTYGRDYINAFMRQHHKTCVKLQKDLHKITYKY